MCLTFRARLGLTPKRPPAVASGRIARVHRAYAAAGAHGERPVLSPARARPPCRGERSGAGSGRACGFTFRRRRTHLPLQPRRPLPHPPHPQAPPRLEARADSSQHLQRSPARGDLPTPDPAASAFIIRCANPLTITSGDAGSLRKASGAVRVAVPCGSCQQIARPQGGPAPPGTFLRDLPMGLPSSGNIPSSAAPLAATRSAVC